MVFVDPIKAFDTIKRKGLYINLRNFGCPGKLVSLIASFRDGM